MCVYVLCTSNMTVVGVRKCVRVELPPEMLSMSSIILWSMCLHTKRVSCRPEIFRKSMLMLHEKIEKKISRWLRYRKLCFVMEWKWIFISFFRIIRTAFVAKSSSRSTENVYSFRENNGAAMNRHAIWLQLNKLNATPTPRYSHINCRLSSCCCFGLIKFNSHKFRVDKRTSIAQRSQLMAKRRENHVNRMMIVPVTWFKRNQ